MVSAVGRAEMVLLRWSLHRFLSLRFLVRHGDLDADICAQVLSTDNDLGRGFYAPGCVRLGHVNDNTRVYAHVLDPVLLPANVSFSIDRRTTDSYERTRISPKKCTAEALTVKKKSSSNARTLVSRSLDVVFAQKLGQLNLTPKLSVSHAISAQFDGRGSLKIDFVLARFVFARHAACLQTRFIGRQGLAPGKNS